jgi:hypothetical protein
VFRSALVGIDNGSFQLPVIIVEPHGGAKIEKKKLFQELHQMAAGNQLTKNIRHFLIHKHFPVDIRHNAKIFREQLAIWAQQQIHP